MSRINPLAWLWRHWGSIPRLQVYIEQSTGNDYENEKALTLSGLVSGYIGGVMDMHESMAGVPGAKRVYCVPGGAAFSDIINAVEAVLPKLDLPTTAANVAVMIVLARLYPCAEELK